MCHGITTGLIGDQKLLSWQNARVNLDCRRGRVMRLGLAMKRGQSIIEYAILVSAVAVVFVTMYYFIQQGMKSKLLSIETEVNDAVRSH